MTIRREIIGGENRKQDKNYIMNEAQMVISSYIGGIEKQRGTRNRSVKKRMNRYKVLKTALFVLSGLFVLNLVLMGLL